MTEADDRRYLDDLHPGQRFTSGTYTMSEAEIAAFARQYDPQPFHLDPVAAAHSLLEGLAASGWHTAAVTMRLLVDGDMKIAGGLVGASGELAWPVPTRPGDVLHVESEVLDVRPSRSRSDRGIVTVRNETKTDDGVIVQSFTANMIVPRRPGTGSAGTH